ncbi:hypothetical protein [Peribacillus glennii]|uniref:DUF5050 domain-containing protein n=1 Tax=Peribacillus glennii TaxID=2303991 RepID=A0A372L8H0_9BACI|nr:hypothetical protein [Peribacillus glennii]RFU61760.1 hypothetical protein D0466_16595 [Peribacillus glennii]
MKKKKFRFYAAVLSAFIGIYALTLAAIARPDVEASTVSTPIHTLKFSNKVQVKTLFYPYRDPAKVSSKEAKGLQGITVDNSSNIYLTYVTGDKYRYGYIYKYNKKGTLLKKSKRLTIGHGQAISYKDGSLYQLADVRGQSNYTLQKINPNTLTVERAWKVPSTIHPNVMAMQDRNTAIAISKSGDGYDINKIHLGAGKEAKRDWREKIHIRGLIGKTPGKEIQGFAIGNGQYYLLSNGEYITFKPDGTNIKSVLLNTKREPEGIAIEKNGKILITFNKLNEVFIQEGPTGSKR